MSRLHRDALSVGLDAARYDRVTSLPGGETYVHLFRESLIGGSPAQSAIVLRENGPQIQARLLHMDRSFWLESLSGGEKITVDGRTIAPRTLVPLAPGMKLKFGNEQVQFDHASQLYLD